MFAWLVGWGLFVCLFSGFFVFKAREEMLSISSGVAKWDLPSLNRMEEAVDVEEN